MNTEDLGLGWAYCAQKCIVWCWVSKLDWLDLPLHGLGTGSWGLRYWLTKSGNLGYHDL